MCHERQRTLRAVSAVFIYKAFPNFGGSLRPERQSFSQGFFQPAPDDPGAPDSFTKGARLIRIRYHLLPSVEATLDWLYMRLYMSRQALIEPVEGTLSGIPVGGMSVWYFPDAQKLPPDRLRCGYDLTLWVSERIVCEIWLDGSGTRSQERLTDIEMHLLENVARKIIANYEGRPFKVLGQAPKDWKVMPASLVWQGKKVKGEGMAVSYDGKVYVSTKGLLALGMKGWRAQKPKGVLRDRKAFKKFYSESIKQVAVRKGETKIGFRVGEKSVVVNGKKKPAELPAKLIDGEPMVPLEVVARAFGLRLVWDEKRRVARVG